MESRDPEYMTFVKGLFERAAFVSELGLRLVDASPGRCNSELQVLPKHLQQDGYVHSGVQATIGDHTAGAVAGTIVVLNIALLYLTFTG